MKNREFLMLSKTYKPSLKLDGWWASEKYDGHRCFWDGGITRGMLKSDVPWANTAKDERYVESPRATGLWTRYGNVFHAPDWWLDQLPNIPMDGELFADRGKWQELSKIIKRLNPDSQAWQQVTFNIIDLPPYTQVFSTGRINNPNFQKIFDCSDLIVWIKKRNPNPMAFRFMTLKESYDQMSEFTNNTVKPILQARITDNAHALSMLASVLEDGGEGLIVRNPRSYWEPKRSDQSIKLKAELDSEATVIGYTWGRETDKGSKLLGLMGAMKLRWNGPKGPVTFELSGFADSERVMTNQEIDGHSRSELDHLARSEGFSYPGEETSELVYNPKFPRGTVITFRYADISNDGIPKCARYWRKWTDGSGTSP